MRLACHLSLPRTFIIRTLIAFATTLGSSGLCAQAQSATSTLVEGYEVHHTVFNSRFLSPEIATIYDIVRGKDKAVANIAVTENGAGAGSLGLPVIVKGVAKNLMQQPTKLNFQEIQEGDATYYIADFEFDDKEILHFYIDVRLPGQAVANKIEFTKKLYHD